MLEVSLPSYIGNSMREASHQRASAIPTVICLSIAYGQGSTTVMLIVALPETCGYDTSLYLVTTALFKRLWGIFLFSEIPLQSIEASLIAFIPFSFLLQLFVWRL